MSRSPDGAPRSSDRSEGARASSDREWSYDSILTRVLEAHAARYGEPPELVVRAPGRVNLIGEHTDYNEGFVLPMAIDRAVWIGLRVWDRPAVEVESLELAEHGRFELAAAKDQARRGEGPGWLEYLKGVAWALQDAGYELAGWRGTIAGEVPMGAGLSSSAALEMATARAFAELCGLELSPGTMAQLGQRAEAQWVGMRCGIMDQLVSAGARCGHALLIDCRTLETRHVPLPGEATVVVLDTGTRRGLADSAYNERRAQCEAAARALGAQALRDVSPKEIRAYEAALGRTVWRRARHVVSENERTLEAARAMEAGELDRLGALMNASHDSLRLDFEVSSDALDTMVRCARDAGCLGARMTGAGFGGCAVALVETKRAGDFAAAVDESYRLSSGHEPSVYVCRSADGAGVVEATDWRQERGNGGSGEISDARREPG